MRMSACSAVSSPPPMQNPRIMAMTGLSRTRQAASAVRAASSNCARASGEVRRSPNSEMSAPDTNALSPAAASTAGSAERISTDMALRLAGLLNVMTATAPSTSTSSLSVPVGRAVVGAVMRSSRGQPAPERQPGAMKRGPPGSDHVPRPEAVDVGCAEAKPGEDVRRVLPGVRARRPDGARRAGHPDRVAHDVQPAKLGMLHRGRHPQVLYLRVGEYLVHPVDRPARHPGRVQVGDPLR